MNLLHRHRRSQKNERGKKPALLTFETPPVIKNSNNQALCFFSSF